MNPSGAAPSGGDADDEVGVRHMQPYEATKSYRCPGCDHEIRAAEGHEVVVPRNAPELRRHWHTACWAADRRRVARDAERASRGSRARRR